MTQNTEAKVFKNDFQRQRYEAYKQFVVVKKGKGCAWVIGSDEYDTIAQTMADKQYKAPDFEYVVMNKDEWNVLDSGDGNWYF